MVDFSLYNTETESMAYIDYIGHGRDGGYADYCVVPSENAYVVDNDLDETELATFCCAYLTAEHMLDRARVKHGETVVVTGASGGVGSGLIQLCRARGAIPVAISSSGYEERLTGVGAEAVLIRNSNPLSLQFESAMPGRCVDVVADLVGGDLFRDLINLLKPEGRYISAGAIAGPVVPLDLRTVYLKHLELHGSSQGSRMAFSDLLGYIRTGKVQPLLDKVYALSQIHQAQQDFISKQFFGKLVVVPDRFYDASKSR
jgi:NADPH:quinone reductase-like Zn-dependent oxidoreductase